MNITGNNNQADIGGFAYLNLIDSIYLENSKFD